MRSETMLLKYGSQPVGTLSQYARMKAISRQAVILQFNRGKVDFVLVPECGMRMVVVPEAELPRWKKFLTTQTKSNRQNGKIVSSANARRL